MKNLPLVLKSNGQQVPFEVTKLDNSLKRAGASQVAIDGIISDIEGWLVEGVTTKEIYSKAFSLLKKKKGGYAARYSLKNSLMELGPTGYPFEHFVGQIFAIQGFDTKVGTVIQGACVQHEVDVLATKNGTQYIVECKYYNTTSKFAPVQVPLYIRSRVNDIEAIRSRLPEYNGYKFHGWIVTNTRFTTDAIDYGRCSGLHLVSWDYPAGHSLKDMIDSYRMFPVTALTHLNNREKRILLDKGIVLCRQLKENLDEVKALGLTAVKLDHLLDEVDDLCGD